MAKAKTKTTTTRKRSTTTKAATTEKTTAAEPVVKEEPVKEEPVKEEPVKEEPVKEEVKEAPAPKKVEKARVRRVFQTVFEADAKVQLETFIRDANISDYEVVIDKQEDGMYKKVIEYTP